jgi:hypothetical protein
MGEEDDRFGRAVLERPRVHSAFAGCDGWTRARHEPLELVTVFQTQRDAWALTGSGGRPGSPSQAPYGADTEGIRLRLQLQTPEEANEETLLRTIDLVQDEDFQRARRRLWSWETTLPPNPDPRDVTAGLEALVADYNAAVRRQQATTRATWVFLIVPTLVGAGLDAVTGGMTGVPRASGLGCLRPRQGAVPYAGRRGSEGEPSSWQRGRRDVGHRRSGGTPRIEPRLPRAPIPSSTELIAANEGG